MTLLTYVLLSFGLWLLGNAVYGAGKGIWRAVQTIRHRPRPVEPNPDSAAVQALLRPHGNVDVIDNPGWRDEYAEERDR